MRGGKKALCPPAFLFFGGSQPRLLEKAKEILEKMPDEKSKEKMASAK